MSLIILLLDFLVIFIVLEVDFNSRLIKSGFTLETHLFFTLFALFFPKHAELLASNSVLLSLPVVVHICRVFFTDPDADHVAIFEQHGEQLDINVSRELYLFLEVLFLFLAALFLILLHLFVFIDVLPLELVRHVFCQLDLHLLRYLKHFARSLF